MSLDADYYNQTCQKKGGIWTYFSGLCGAGGAHTLTLLRSDAPPMTSATLPIPPATFVLKVAATSVTGHTDLIGTVTVNAEVMTWSGAGSAKFTTTGLTATPTISVADMDCNIVITAYESSADLYEWFTSACRWKPDAIMFIASGGSVFTQSKAVIITDAVYAIGDILRLVGGTDTAGQLVKMITCQLNIDGIVEGRTYFI